MTGDVAQHHRARIGGLVHRVPEPHDAIAGTDRVAHPRFGAVGRADGVEGVEGAARRATVQRARQRAERSHHRGADVGAGRRHHARRERRRVEAVVDAEDQVLLDGTGATPGRGPRRRSSRGSWPRARGRRAARPARARATRGAARRSAPAWPRRAGSRWCGWSPDRRRTWAACPRPRRAARARCAARRADAAGPRRARAGASPPRAGGAAAAAIRRGVRVARRQRAGSSPSKSRYHTSSKRADRRQLGGRVLAVVVEALEASHVAELGVGDDHTLQAAGGGGVGHGHRCHLLLVVSHSERPPRPTSCQR